VYFWIYGQRLQSRYGMDRMNTRCEHWNGAGVSHGGRCTLFCVTCSLGVCRECRFNTAMGQWPAKGYRPKAGPIPAGERKPCGGCQKRAHILNGDL
jgi:hypothetical protein